MRPGDVVGGRFLVVSHVADGGMGAVFRGVDQTTGAACAVKTLRGLPTDDALLRFEREAKLLSSLEHDCVVRALASGRTPEGLPWLAMEWLEGEDLDRRLARAPLSAADALVAIRRAASGLAAAHERGLVHRDVKPANLFLPGGEPARLVVVDLGVARPLDATRRLTATNAIVGTLAYMAPEQTSGGRDVDPRADVFALGAVLFECLAGRPLLVADSAVELLTKLLVEPLPSLRALRPDLPDDVCALVAQCTARDPAARPTDAAALVAALDALAPLSAPAPAPPAPARAESAQERVIATLLLAALDGDPESGATWTPEARGARLATLGAVAARLDAEPLPEVGGGVPLLVRPRGASATDLVARAVRAALAVADALPDARVAIVTGAVERTSTPVAAPPLLERARALLRTRREPRVLADPVTAGLLDARFELVEVGPQAGAASGRSIETSGSVGVVGLSQRDEARLLFGKPTPFVGRERELASLLGLVSEALGDRSPRAALVVAEPGAGKSRLRRELVRRLHDAGGVVGGDGGDGGERVLEARGDLVSAGSPWDLARQLVRGALGAAAADRASLAASLAGRVSEPTTLELLGELLGLPSSDPPSPALAAARAEPALLTMGLQRAVSAWLEAELARPLVVVIDDLQWADGPSVSVLAAALEAPRDRALALVAFARPEVREVFPDALARAERVVLAPLPRRAAERLVRAVLGDLPPERLDALVARAGGNALWLEELIRRAGAGAGDDAPETLIALAQARLGALPDDVRRVARLAAVAGERFDDDAAAAAAGAEPSAVRPALEALVRLEVLARAAGGWEFRHALLRDAAEGLSSDDERREAHERVARHLERAPQADPIALFGHWRAAGELERAGAALLRAAAQVSDLGDPEGMLRLVRAAEGLALPALFRSRLLTLEATALEHSTRGEEAIDRASRALELAPPASAEWFEALAVLAVAKTQTPGPDSFSGFAVALLALAAVPPERLVPSRALGFLFYALLANLSLAGLGDGAGALLARAEALRGSPTALRSFRAWVATGRAAAAAYAPAEGHCLDLAKAAVAEMVALGDRRGEAVAHMVLGFQQAMTTPRLALETAERGLVPARAVRYQAMEAVLELVRGLALGELGRTGRLEPIEAIEAIVASNPAHEFARFGHLIATYAAGVEAAAREAAAGLASSPVPTFAFVAHLYKARLAVARGAFAEALDAVDAALRLSVGWGVRFAGEALRLDVLAALGRGVEAAGRAAVLRAELEAIVAQASAETRAELEAWPALQRIRALASR